MLIAQKRCKVNRIFAPLSHNNMSIMLTAVRSTQYGTQAKGECVTIPITNQYQLTRGTTYLLDGSCPFILEGQVVGRKCRTVHDKAMIV